MERIKGDPLNTLWESFTPRKQKQVMVRLLEHLQSLRSIPSQGLGYYGRVNYQGYHPDYLLLRLDNKNPLGPYDSYKEFVSTLSKASWLRRALALQRPTFYLEEIEALKEHETALLQTKPTQPVLTHIDPTYKNIIVVPGNSENDWDLVFVDLEGLAWMPAWLQALICLDRSVWDGEHRSFFAETMTQIFGESFDEDIQRYERLERWVRYPL